MLFRHSRVASVCAQPQGLLANTGTTKFVFFTLVAKLGALNTEVTIINDLMNFWPKRFKGILTESSMWAYTDLV